MTKEEKKSKKMVEGVYQWGMIFKWAAVVLVFAYFFTIKNASLESGRTLNDLFMYLMTLSIFLSVLLTTTGHVLRHRHTKRFVPELAQSKVAMMYTVWIFFLIISIPVIIFMSSLLIGLVL